MCGLSVWYFMISAMVQPAADCAITTSSFPAAFTACYRLGAVQVSLVMHDVWFLLEPDRQQTSALQSVLGRYCYGACAFGTALHVQRCWMTFRQDLHLILKWPRCLGVKDQFLIGLKHT